jgi:hypothetical protein
MQETYALLARDDPRVELLQAYTYREALEMADAHETLDAVIADGQLPPSPGKPIEQGPHALRMHALIGHLRREGFKGPILVTSGADVYARRMMEAGGTETCAKAEALDRALKLLGHGGIDVSGPD